MAQYMAKSCAHHRDALFDPPTLGVIAKLQSGDDRHSTVAQKRGPWPARSIRSPPEFVNCRTGQRACAPLLLSDLLLLVEVRSNYTWVKMVLTRSTVPGVGKVEFEGGEDGDDITVIPPATRVIFIL